MGNFKEWLFFEQFTDDVILPIRNRLTSEIILEEFLRQFLESTSESYYKDSEIDCQKCKYHGKFNHLGGSSLECPECKDVVSDSEISECEHCNYVGRFDEKDEGNFCPKCGKKEVVELDDPFAGGDEDASPISIDDEAIEKERRDAEEERKRAELEKDRLNRVAQKRTGIRKSGKRSKDAESVEDMRPEEREFATRLKNNALWLRWHSMIERKKDIDRLKDIATKAGITSVKESVDIFDITDDDEPSAEKISREEYKEAEEILTRLGYLSPERLDLAKTPESRDRMVMNALKSAIGEEGNDLPPGVDESELITPVMDGQGKPQKDRWGRVRTSPSEAVRRAQDELIRDLSGLDGPRDHNNPDGATNPFKKAFNSVARKDSIKLGSKKDAGHKFYSDPEDVANDFLLSIMKMLKTRRVSSAGGKAAPWGSIHSDHKNLGSGGKKDLERDDMVADIMRAWRSRIFSLAKTAESQQRTTMSPSARRPDEVSKRSEVNSRMNKDIRDVKVALYAKSMLSSGSSMSEVAEKLGMSEDDVKRISEDPYASIRFHMLYLNKLVDGREPNSDVSSEVPAAKKTFSKKKKKKSPQNNEAQMVRIVRGGSATSPQEMDEDKLRLRLMRQLVMRSSPQSGITLDAEPQKLLKSLEIYRDNFSSKGRANVIFAGQSGGDEDSGDSSDLGKGLDMLAQIRSDDEAPESTGVFSGASREINPHASVDSSERRTRMLRSLYEAILALYNKKGDAGKWQALAVCIKLGLPIDNNTGRIVNWTSDTLMNSTLISFFNQKPKKTAADFQWDCFQHINSIGSVSICPNCTMDNPPGKPCQNPNACLHGKLNAIRMKTTGETRKLRSTQDYLSNGLKFICDYLQTNLSSDTAWTPTRTSGS